MNKRILIILIALLLVMIEALFLTNFRKVEKNNNAKLANRQDAFENNSSFYGKVIESTIDYIIVEPDENEEERKSSDKISINLGENNDALYYVGTRVKITYTGEIMESYPAQVKAVKIEIKSADKFELKIGKNTVNEKIKKIIDADKTDLFDYNVY